MHPLQCHGPYRPSMFSDPPVISSSAYSSPTSCSPSPAGYLSSDARLETASPVTSSPSVPSSSENSTSPTSQQLQQQASPGNRKYLKRRASQGSVPSKPSSVSRLLSREPAAANNATTSSIGRSASANAEASDTAARTQTLDSPLRLSTTSAPPRPEESAWQGEYSSALPPTPPEDNDAAVGWNTNDGMLLIEPQINPSQGPLHARAAPTVDGISSPSDQLSSAAGSPGSNDMECDYNTWLENGIEAASKFFVSRGLLMI